MFGFSEIVLIAFWLITSIILMVISYNAYKVVGLINDFRLFEKNIKEICEAIESSCVEHGFSKNYTESRCFYCKHPFDWINSEDNMQVRLATGHHHDCPVLKASNVMSCLYE